LLKEINSLKSSHLEGIGIKKAIDLIPKGDFLFFNLDKTNGFSYN
jgi:hypothetical protein